MDTQKLLLTVATPFIAAGSGWLCAAAGKYGVSLDPSGVNALATAGATAGAAAMLKLIHDLERRKHMIPPVVVAAKPAAAPAPAPVADPHPLAGIQKPST